MARGLFVTDAPRRRAADEVEDAVANAQEVAAPGGVLLLSLIGRMQNMEALLRQERIAKLSAQEMVVLNDAEATAEIARLQSEITRLEAEVLRLEGESRGQVDPTEINARVAELEAEVEAKQIQIQKLAEDLATAMRDGQNQRNKNSRVAGLAVGAQTMAENLEIRHSTEFSAIATAIDDIVAATNAP